MCVSKYQISILDLYSPLRHGELKTELNFIYNNYLIYDTINKNDFYNNLNNIIKSYKRLHKKYIIQNSTYVNEQIHNWLSRINCPNIIIPSIIHPNIRNYDKIIEDPKHFELKIVLPVKVYFGPSEEDYYATAINKTIA